MKQITHDFKNWDAAKGFLSIDLNLLKLIPLFLEWCNKNSLPFVVTRGLSENIEGVSKSDTHPEGRAIDVSVKGWPADKIAEFETFCNSSKECEEFGAISASDGKKRLVVYHVGTGPHFHIQTKR